MRKSNQVSVAVAGIILCFILRPTPLGAKDGVEQAGTAVLVALSAAGATLTLLCDDAEGSRQMAISGLVTEGLTLVLKYAIDEKRPNGGHHSFPSGHSALAFSAAEFMRARYGWTYGAVAYGAACFVAYSRVAAHQHYVHDVLAGAALGAVTSTLLTTPHKGWRVSLLGDEHTLAVSVEHSW